MPGLKEKIPRPLIAPLRWFKNHLPIYSRVMVRKDQEQLRQVETELPDAQVLIRQLRAMIKELGGYLPPPSKLQKHVVNLLRPLP